LFFQDEALRRAVMLNGAKNWKKIAEAVPGRTDVQCLHRWQKVLNPDLVKGPWTKEVFLSLEQFSIVIIFWFIHFHYLHVLIFERIFNPILLTPLISQGG
jgi:hypothetical protein